MSDHNDCVVPASQIFTEALALIDSPHKFYRGGYAAMSNDYPVTFTSPEACKFCALGALYRVVMIHRPRRGMEIYLFPDSVFQVITITLPSNYAKSGLSALNDYGGYDAVQKFFADAIIAAKQREEDDAKRNSEDAHREPTSDGSQKSDQ